VANVLDTDLKKLWGLAAGRCAYPGCATSLIQFAPNEDPVVIGEIAHVIARSPTGPRGSDKPPNDKYDNLILLCPTHHTLVDKASEGVFTPEILLEWKTLHENRMAEVPTDMSRNEGQAQPGIRVNQPTKECVTVAVVITHTGQRYKIALPLDMLVAYATPELVRVLELPDRFANDWPIDYHLYSKSQGQELDADLTLRQNGVSDGDTLSLHVHIEAG
jgi:WXG100 protein secretion system (Wss), protein YukD/HNH endonuclease